MTNQFLIQYVREQFGVPPYDITPSMERAALAAWKARQETNDQE